jgi:prepilin-type N-terminal cleavage/methylation domain-containing protein
MKARWQGESGLSLIEVLAGIAIFSVVAAGLASSTVATIRANAVSRDTATAAALIQDKLEQFRALDPAGNPADLTAGTHSDANNPVNALGAAGGSFTRKWTVTANTPRRGLSQVVVTVSWASAQRRTLTGVAYVCSTSTCS